MTDCCDPADLVGNLAGLRSVPPYVASGVEAYSFPVPASFPKLKRLCDRFLNDPADGATGWRPMGAFMYIVALRYDRLISAPYAQYGYISQHELAFQIPIAWPTRPTAPRVGVFSAHLVVDNPLSLTGGREVFGFPKTMGAFSFDPPGMTVDQWLTPAEAPSAKYEPHPLFEVAGLKKSAFAGADDGDAGNVKGGGDGGGIEARLWPFGPSVDLFIGRDGQDPAFRLDGDIKRLLFLNGHPILQPAVAVEQLKEIDSLHFNPVGPQKAAYQARVSARSHVTLMRGAGMAALTSLKIHRYPLFNLIDIFGLPADAAGRVPVFFPFWLDFDFVINDATLLTKRC